MRAVLAIFYAFLGGDVMSETLPGRLSGLPLLPLRGIVLFPHASTPLDVGRERSVRAVEQALASGGQLVLATQKDAAQETPSFEQIYHVGVLAVVKHSVRLPSGQLKVIVEAVARVRIVDLVSTDPHYTVDATVLTPAVDPASAERLDTLVQALLRQFERYVVVGRRLPGAVLPGVSSIDDPDRLADVIAAQLPTGLEKRQQLLEEVEIARRIETLIAVLAEELEIIELENRIQGRVREQIEKNQKEYMLREQLKAIRKELGEDDERTAEMDEYRERLKTVKLPKAARDRVEEELRRLERMPPASAEAVVVRTYLDWMLALPWKKRTKKAVHIDEARRILDADHYGLEKVKERILEFLAVQRMADKVRGPILCLAGPPGVGKTSLAKSVAKALGRRFVRISLGGVRDEAEVRGHRRTYVGAMPGKIIQALKQAGTANPVMLLDEVDKMASDFRGDPAAALLEVLDPEQNSSFADHYIEVPFDLSDVFFITTANVLAGIPAPLRDRMEIIQLAGYTEEEKLGIARHHLVPKQMEMHGLADEHLAFSDNALRQMIARYTREAGVRQLERTIAAVCRKVALEVVEGREGQARVTARNVEKYLGPPHFRRNEAEAQDQVGVATGLAYTQVGGDILAIEVSVLKGKGNLLLTGKLGEVMRESAQTAFSYVRSRHGQLGLLPHFHETADVHVHVPEGDVPKDGPSAGVAIAVALASALTGRPVSHEVAMTGEVTLRGRVLPIGGVKEKVLAAHRAGIRRVILPAENRHDLEEVPVQVRRSLDIRLVRHMDEVLRLALVQQVDEAERETAAALEGSPLLPPAERQPAPWLEQREQNV